MGEETAGQEAGKPKKRMAAKPPVRPTASKVKSTIHLSVEASQRLDIHWWKNSSTIIYAAMSFRTGAAANLRQEAKQRRRAGGGRILGYPTS
jgi:hypothetical protein